MPIYDVSVKIRDSYSRSTTKRYQVEAIDHAAAVTATGQMCNDLAGAMEAEIIEHSVALKTAFTDSPLAGSNLDEGLTLSVETTGGKKAVLKVPAPVKGPVNPDGTVDITDVLISDYVDNWLAGGFKVSDGETVTAVLSGKLDR